MKLDEQFGENSFDAVYAIEATCHAPNWEGIYGQIKKVLKPGGIVSIYSSSNRVKLLHLTSGVLCLTEPSFAPPVRSLRVVHD